MSNGLQNLLKDALLNNSYDYDVMHNTLKKTWMNSYSYLYTLQKSYIEYEELFYFSNDTESRNSKRIGHLYLDNRLRANFDVDYDVIHVNNREEYRKSRFYQDEFTIKDMTYNPNIFLKIPIVIIDDKIIWDYKIKITKDCTHFILPFKRNFVIKNERNDISDDIIYIDHKIQVLIVDNIFYQRFTMNKSNLYYNNTKKTISIPKSSIESMVEKSVANDTNSDMMEIYNLKSILDLTNDMKKVRDSEYNKRIKYMKVPTQKGTMMCSIHFPNESNMGYELGTIMIPMEYDSSNQSYTAALSNDIANKINLLKHNVYVSLWFMNRLYHHKFYTGKTKTTATDNGTNLMVVQESEMQPYSTPIPVENFMVFKKFNSVDGYILEKNTDMLELYYPNIYKIKDSDMKVGDTYDIYYFYHKADDLKYTVLFDFYYVFLASLYKGQSIEKIINDIYYNRNSLSEYSEEEKKTFSNVFEKILNYQYFNHQYGETDFLNRYLPIKENKDKEPIEYKDETLKEWMRVEPWVLRDYVLEQNKLGSSYHLFTNTIDLSTRKRMNTKLELVDTIVEFDEPHYVFAFNNEKEYHVLLNCRVFVDGLMVCDLYHNRRLFMDYLYIPSRMVTKDSYIEIEIFPSYTFKEEMTFKSLNDEKTVSIAEPEDVIFPTIQDIYFENTEKTSRFSVDNFEITAHYSRGDFKCVTTDNKKPVVFTRISTFKIKPKSTSVLNKPLHLKINKRPVAVQFTSDKNGLLYLQIPDSRFIYNTEFIRIYRNGRLLPINTYKLQVVDNYLRIQIFEYIDKGDNLYIDITPYRYKEIYHQKELSKDNTLIDLRGVINKPFDIRYYDVYMNGRKLSLNNVFSISPWLITLVNLKSNYDLIIFERERDWEYFGLDYTENIYYYTIGDLFESGIVKDDIKNSMIKNIIDTTKDPRLTINPNTNNEQKENWNAVSDYVFHYDIFYYDDLIPKSYVNPDLLQDSSSMLKVAFPTIYNTYKTTSIDDTSTTSERNRKKNYPDVICLNPDILYTNNSDSEDIVVYNVGHRLNVSEEYLNTDIEIPSEGNIQN